MLRKIAVAIAAAFMSVATITPASAATCLGNCGTTFGSDGVVTIPPSGTGMFDWISTNLGLDGIGQLPIGGTNGSQLTSDSFYAAAGATVQFYFNYISSDGADFADYGWAQLRGGADPITLFTARTESNGEVVPGFGLPDINATLNPSKVFIVPGATQWSQLGGDSGACFDTGCGSTGWIQSSYTIETAGTYQLAFGVSNWSDTALQSGMAFSGLVIDGIIIGDGSSSTNPLPPTDVITETGSFEFTFTPTPNQMVFIDPDYATGYDYAITEGENSILAAWFPELAGDDGFYEVSYGGITEIVQAGVNYVFNAPVTAFSLTGIDVAAMVNPLNPNGFVTGLTFATSAEVVMTQTPTGIVTVPDLPVPEPASWAVMLGGFGAMGFAMRRRRQRALMFA